MADLTTAIETQMQKLLACFKANDMKGVANLYTEDCKVMIPGMDTQYGPEGAENVHVGLWAGGVRTVEMETDEIGPMGSDVIYYRAAYTTKAEDGSVTDVGKNIVIWKKVGEEWFLYIDIFNSNNKA